MRVITIRNEQMKYLSRPILDNFVERAFVMIQRHWGHKVKQLGDAAAREMIYRGVLEAFGHGFVVEQQVMRYLNVMFALGEGFANTHPWASRVLKNARLKPDMKTALLVERTNIFLDGFAVE